MFLQNKWSNQKSEERKVPVTIKSNQYGHGQFWATKYLSIAYQYPTNGSYFYSNHACTKSKSVTIMLN